MNYFTKKRLITWAITVLIIVNATSLVTIWMQQHGPIRPPQHELPKDSKEATTFFLKKELEFSDSQVMKFMEMQDEFFKKSQQYQQLIGDTKKELFSGLIDNKSVNKEDLIAKIGSLNSQREELLYEYFQDVKNLCTEKQQKKYKMLIGQILMRISPNRVPPGRRENPQQNNHPGQNRPGQMPPPPRDGQRPDGPSGNMPPPDGHRHPENLK